MFTMRLVSTVFMVALAGLIPLSAVATDRIVDNPWVDSSLSLVSRSDLTSVENKNLLTLSGRPLTISFTDLSDQLLEAGDFVLPLPLPDGRYANYQFSRSSVMPPLLAEKYPLIQTFTATDLNDSNNTGRFDITPKGFHGMFKHDGRWVFIDPELRNRADQYISYYGDNALPLSSRGADTVFGSARSVLSARGEIAIRAIAGEVKRTYRLAISAAAEYVAFHGGSKADGLAAIVTMLHRVNEVFERDLAISFELVANNDEIIYTNSLTDPFSNDDDDVRTNVTVLSEAIGDDNFDIGHVLNTGGGGKAALGVCNPALKAVGMTGTSTPTGDAFYIDYVAHEIGHQLGANHSFNGTSLACRGNRNAETAWEPGSGSSIMSYAGICDEQDVQANASGFFHIGSIEEILAFTAEAACGVESVLENTSPEIDAGLDYVIPSNTPFKLSGIASDEDADTLSYIWEQVDIGTASNSIETMVDDGTRPLFRSWEFEGHGDRYFPRFQDILVDEGYTTVGESYPNSNRDMTFRLTVRDGKGGVSTDETIVTVSHGSGAFRVTSPEQGTELRFGDELLIQWDVADTDIAPISCSSVGILLSDNAGISFDHIITASAPNSGEFAYTLPDEVLSNGRILVHCLDNVFFAVNNGEFQVTSAEVRGVDVDTDEAGSTKSGGGGSVSWLLFSLLLLVFRPVSLLASK